MDDTMHDDQARSMAGGGPAGPGVSYDYRTLTVQNDDAPLVRDTFARFRWSEVPGGHGGRRPGWTVLRLRRDRHLDNGPVVDQLQARAEESLATIGRLRRSLRSVPWLLSAVVFVLGCVPLAGSIFAINADLVPLSAVLGVIGLILWALAVVVHRPVARRRERRVTPRIAQERDRIDDAAQQALRLLPTV
ncbi:hypothetical protein ACT3TZ_09270 [Brachybacterium sp. AOP25-B2-12]|uniref:hypothetical protein n=1 Tax=Brachybacterium sp. AOP25-B2-12 TaxID=3457710 RepID=UPI0040333354